jgi:dihydrofolate reductase
MILPWQRPFNQGGKPMQRLIVFNSISVDGYFTDQAGDMSWAHRPDAEWNEFAAGNAKGGGSVVFGRVTYQLMERFWPTPAAAQMNAEVAHRMNSMEKIVFSRTLHNVTWSNTRLMKGDLAEETRKLKEEPGEGLAILGSGSIVAQLTQAGLIDEYQFVVSPVVLGAGRTLFEGVQGKVPLRLTKTRAFGNGNVVLTYEPSRK